MSEDVSMGTPGARNRAAAIWIAVGVVALGVIGAIIAFAMIPNGLPSGAPSGSPTPVVTATPAPAADPTAVGDLDDDAALEVIETALTAPFATVGTAADLQELLKNIAVDAYAEELEAQWQELISQGWTISGTPTLVTAEVTSLDADAQVPHATVTACVDSSEVVISDAAGDRIGDPAAMTPRALHLFALLQGEDGVWRISEHSFPNDPNC